MLYVFGLICLYVNAFVTPTFEDYINAVLQSTGHAEYDETFMNWYYDAISITHTHEPSCHCEGCFISNECISCLNKKTCEQIQGTYCENE